MKMKARGREKWIEIYGQMGHAGLTCLRCGISRPTLRTWSKRYLEKGEEGLTEQTRRPHHSPTRKISEQLTNLVMDLRRSRNIGPGGCNANFFWIMTSGSLWAPSTKYSASPRQSHFWSSARKAMGVVMKPLSPEKEFKWIPATLARAWINIQR